MLNVKKQAGENAMQKMIRLLAKFNDEMVEEGSGDVIAIKLNADGSGLLTLSHADGFPPQTLFGFGDATDLVQYLEARPLDRLTCSVIWATGVGISEELE